MEKGDLVRLKAGGRTMGVASMDAPEEVECFWYDGGRRMSEMFPREALEKVSSVELFAEAAAESE